MDFIYHVKKAKFTYHIFLFDQPIHTQKQRKRMLIQLKVSEENDVKKNFHANKKLQYE